MGELVAVDDDLLPVDEEDEFGGELLAPSALECAPALSVERYVCAQPYHTHFVALAKESFGKRRTPRGSALGTRVRKKSA